MKLRTYLVILVMIVVAWLLLFGGLGEWMYSGTIFSDENTQYGEYRKIKYGVGAYDSTSVYVSQLE